MQPYRAQHSCGGFSLVEVLVALVVLSIGLLGIAALHVEGLRSGRTALTRSTAVMLAADMADRIRGNRGGKLEYETVLTKANTNAKCKPAGAGCTVVELARHDKATWLGLIDAALPGGTGTIDCVTACNDPATADTYTITITWSEVNAAAPSTYVLTIQA